MRVASLVVVVVVAIAALGSASRAAPSPTQRQRARLVAVEQELTQHQIKQAFFAAVKAAREAYQIAREVYGEEAPETLPRMQTLAALLHQTGDHPGALALYQKLLAIAEKQHGPQSRQALNALVPMFGPLSSQNRYDELEPLAQRVLALTRKLDGENSISHAAQLTSYGGLLLARSQYSSAQRVFEKALAVHEALAGKRDDLALLSPLQLLANVYWQTHQWPKAIALYDRAIAIVESAPGSNVAMKASTMWGIASIYHYAGRDELAAPLRARVVKLYEAEIARLEKASPDDPMLPSLLGQLGYTYRQAGDLANAEKALARSVALDENRHGFAGWAGALAEIKRAQGKPKDALALLERAQAELTKRSAQSATTYNTIMADVLRELGDVARAEKLILAHLDHLARTYGKRHPIYGMSQLSAAYVYIAAGRIPEAERMLAESLESSERELSLVLQTGTEADHAVYFARSSYQLDTAINFHRDHAPRRASAARLGLTTLLRRKGRVLDAAAASLATIRARLSREDKRLLDDLAAARAQLAKLMVAGPSATGQADYAREVARLEDQIQKLEVAVGKRSAAYRVVSQPITLADVQKRIPARARLVEIVNFQPADPRPTYRLTPVALPRRYAAYVVGRTGDPVLVDLGPAADIDDAVAKFRKAVSNPRDARALDMGRALYDLTLAKIEPVLGGATELLIAPDGALNVVPFSALVDAQQQFLIQRFTFTYLTSGRDLLRLAVKTKAQGGGVLFADPAFDTGAPAPTSNAPATRGRRSAALSSLAWPRLPGTAEEADAVARRLAGLTVYRGAKATETALKQVRGPRILHLATHGFFLPDAPRRDAAPAPQAPFVGPVVPVAQLQESPLLRSGLALAGANQLVSGEDDGILTALEATGLDLWGTELVVLSACETGVGKVTNGDGVYGLRRALVIAGAESLVMSLWQVDDLATKELMDGYYTRLRAGRPRSSALREVQLELLGRREYAHPFFWASFLPAGANTPLGR